MDWVHFVGNRSKFLDTATHRQLTFAEIGSAVQRTLKRVIVWLWIICGIAAGMLYFYQPSAVFPFVVICASSIGVMMVWASNGRGLPMLALIAAQNLIIYGLPIVAGNETVFQYSLKELNEAAWEVFAMNVAMAAGWRMAKGFINPGSAFCYALLGLDSASPRLTRLAIAMLAVGTAYEVADNLNLLWVMFEHLPAGSNSIIHALMSAVSACGCFLSGLMIGRRQASRTQSTVFWALIAVQCVVSAAGFLLSSAVIIVLAAIIGLFWGSGRVPWRFVAIVVLMFGYFNIGKFVMRDKYWATADGEQEQGTSFADMPSRYREWAEASMDILLGNAVVEQHDNSFNSFALSPDETPAGQSLLQRINNLENLLFAIDAVETKHVRPLSGATYSLIPQLLVPRILWPDKPRSHEGQVLLNVYFGRQDLNSTFRTYIAWGLLPEAYGNFGPWTGAIGLGLFLGIFFAWVEQYTVKKLILSLEGFLGFTLFLGMANSYEMVASVLVTSLYQAFVPIIIACAPFVARISPRHQPAARVDDATPNS